MKSKDEDKDTELKGNKETKTRISQNLNPKTKQLAHSSLLHCI